MATLAARLVCFVMAWSRLRFPKSSDCKALTCPGQALVVGSLDRLQPEREMSMKGSSQRVSDEDVKSTATVRRSSLGRLGLAAGLAGIAGVSQSCGGEEATSSDVT